ncbi:diacylglycerol/polyprenol kinase family protein [Parasynechococcus sp.]|uniref:diacylglycerol/polyprenol kinase family protein n=1 Tax=Parasynechococcus sp. TaxID=3101203 RepID=UPI003704612B
MTVLLGPAVIALWLLVILLSAVACRSQWPGQRELSRKIVHIGTGAVLPMAWWFAIPKPMALGVAGTVTVLIALNHRWRWFAAMEDVDRTSVGTIAYAAAITVLLALFWPQRPDAVCAAVLVMALGDGLAGLIGRGLTSPQWTVGGQRKSLAGTLTMAVVSLTVLVGVGWLGNGVPSPLTLTLMTSSAVLLEQFSAGGVDNLTVPISVGLLWQQFVR